MNRIFRFLTLTSLAAGSLLAATTGSSAENWLAGMNQGKHEFKSISKLSFGPEGILFVADAKAGEIVAIATGDTKAVPVTSPLKVAAIKEKVAGLLGTGVDQIILDDLAVNPISHNSYLAVSRGSGPTAVPVLVRVKIDGQLEAVSLDAVKFSVAPLPDGSAEPAAGQPAVARPASSRRDAITDIAFFQDRVLVAGLSNEEFASTFRAIPFPFRNVPMKSGSTITSVEMYHGSHGGFETRSPVRTFVPFNVGDHPSLLAAYTCTPLVEIPMSDLQPGAKVKGKTIAELGNRNKPIDMIVYQKEGKDYLLLANSSRGVMKISTDNIEKAEGILSKVPDTKGLKYETIAGWSGVDHLDKYDAKNALVLRTDKDGTMNLESLTLP